ncbi:MAG: hypothetical protein EKK62_07675 [Acidimicrobiia bacterium]|nr:MAG: hypothetical protein EKK62_07675 [Acidimicrobiia bacterium]
MITTDAHDLASYAPAEAWFTVGDYLEPLVEVPPGPGDPDTEHSPLAPEAWPTRGPEVSVVVGRAISREVIGPLLTAEVEHWDDDVELLAGTSAGITASSFDPLLAAMAESTHLKADGTLGYSWDPRGYIAWVYRDGAPVWTGAFFQPIEVGGGRVSLPAVGPQEQFAQRHLGRAEQLDLLGNKGSFEGYSSIAQMEADGWQFPEDVSAAIVTDGVRGTKALRLTGGAQGTGSWVRSPKVTVTGAEGYSRVVDGQVFGKWADIIPQGTVVARARVQRVGASTPNDTRWADENAGTRPDDEAGWTDDPVTFAARMEPDAVAHHAWIELRSFAGQASYYDLAQLRLSVQTGYPRGTTRDLADYVVRVLRDLAAKGPDGILGGHPHGLVARIVSRTGVLVSKRWAHAARTPVRDVLASILDADGGPECRITPGWNLLIHDRLGSDRDDIALTNRDVVAPGWQEDPGAQIDDYLVDTGRGSGVNWLAAAYSVPERDDRFRQQAIVQGPTDRSLDEIASWARAHGRVAARRQVTCEVDVSWTLADQIVTGDSLWVALSDGDLVIDRRMRVLRKRYAPASMLCRLSLGEAGA